MEVCSLSKMEEAKNEYELAGKKAEKAFLDKIYMFDNKAEVEKCKQDYLEKKQKYEEIKKEFLGTISVPNQQQLVDLLKKSTVFLPPANSTSFKVFHEVEEKLWKLNYAIPPGRKPELNKVLWISE